MDDQIESLAKKSVYNFLSIVFSFVTVIGVVMSAVIYWVITDKTFQNWTGAMMVTGVVAQSFLDLVNLWRSIPYQKVFDSSKEPP